MHRPTLTLAGTRGATAEFSPEVIERDALGDHVMHTTIDSADVILIVQACRHCRRDNFLPAWRVVRHDQLAGLQHRTKTLIILFDPSHAPVDAYKDLAVRDCGCHFLILHWNRIKG
ncbi:hypothetical protein D3C76_1372390 [compost metagenome]